MGHEKENNKNKTPEFFLSIIFHFLKNLMVSF